jgi:hypothetical protein
LCGIFQGIYPNFSAEKKEEILQRPTLCLDNGLLKCKAETGKIGRPNTTNKNAGRPYNRNPAFIWI